MLSKPDILTRIGSLQCGIYSVRSFASEVMISACKCMQELFQQWTVPGDWLLICALEGAFLDIQCVHQTMQYHGTILGRVSPAMLLLPEEPGRGIRFVDKPLSLSVKADRMQGQKV